MNISEKLKKLAKEIEAGGPGSGVIEPNTEFIDFLKTSPLVSIHKRKDYMDKNKFKSVLKVIPVEKIRYKGQEKFVPKKLNRFIDSYNSGDDWTQKPVDVICDDNGDYHIMDGHHRGLAAIKLNLPKLKANVYFHIS